MEPISGFCDAHCHLRGPGEAGAALAAARRAGVRAVAVWGTEPRDWIRPDGAAVPEGLVVRQGFGLHPWKLAAPLPAGWEVRLEEELRNDSALCVGECGLDFRPGMPPRELQLATLRVQWELARRNDRPISLHAVRARGALLERVRDWGPVRGQLHAFEGSPEIARELARAGFWFSVGPGLLRPSRPASAVRALFDALPRGRVMLETDSPEPGDLPAFAAGLAEALGMDVGELAASAARSLEAWLDGREGAWAFPPTNAERGSIRSRSRPAG